MGFLFSYLECEYNEYMCSLSFITHEGAQTTKTHIEFLTFYVYIATYYSIPNSSNVWFVTYVHNRKQITNWVNKETKG